jgi:hypothetical protein
MQFRHGNPQMRGDGRPVELRSHSGDQTESAGGLCLQPAVPTQIDRYGEGLLPLAVGATSRKALRQG